MRSLNETFWVTRQTERAARDAYLGVMSDMSRVKALARIMAGAGDITVDLLASGKVDLLASGKMASAGRSGGALKGAIMGFKRDGVTCVDKSIEGRDGEYMNRCTIALFPPRPKPPRKDPPSKTEPET